MRSLVLNKQMTIVAGRDGYFLVNVNDVYIGRGLVLYGEYNAAEAAFLHRLVNPGDCVIEVGANIGSHTIGLAKAVGAHGEVHAFEPQRACYALLQAQIALNQALNVRAYNVACGLANKRLWVPRVDYAQPNNFGAVALSGEDSAAAEEVEATSLDERFGGTRVALIKIDVEGMEEDVLRGGVNIIRKNHPLLYVENDRIDKSRSLIALILELGYRLWWHIPRLFNPDNFFNVRANVFGDAASFNMICSCEKIEAVKDLVEIKSPDDPHPAAPPPVQTGWQYSINTRLE